mgnify:CR=1 FL=1
MKKNKGYLALLIVAIIEMVYSANNPDRYNVLVPVFMGAVSIFLISTIIINIKEK